MDINHIIDAFDYMNPYLDLNHLFRFDTSKGGGISIADVNYDLNQLLYQSN